MLLNNSEHSPHSDEEKKQGTDFVAEWVAELASTNLHDRLIEDVGTESWEHHLEQEAWEGRIRDLATHLLQHPADFDQELAWLNSDKARSSVEFGMQLGRLDETLGLLDGILAACRESRNPNLARGYFAGVSEYAWPKLPSEAAEEVHVKLNRALDVLWEDDPVRFSCHDSRGRLR